MIFCPVHDFLSGSLQTSGQKSPSASKPARDSWRRCTPLHSGYVVWPSSCCSSMEREKDAILRNVLSYIELKRANYEAAIGIGAMTQHSNDDETTRQLRAGAHPGFLRKLPTAANDNTDNGPWPLIPFPNGIDFPAGQDLFRGPSHPDKVAPPTPLSWRAKLGLAAYAVAASVVLLGWLCFIWTVLIFIWVELIAGVLQFVG